MLIYFPISNKVQILLLYIPLKSTIILLFEFCLDPCFIQLQICISSLPSMPLSSWGLNTLRFSYTFSLILFLMLAANADLSTSRERSTDKISWVTFKKCFHSTQFWLYLVDLSTGFPGSSDVKKSACSPGLDPELVKIPIVHEMATYSRILPQKSHGRRNWHRQSMGQKELNTCSKSSHSSFFGLYDYIFLGAGLRW